LLLYGLSQVDTVVIWFISFLFPPTLIVQVGTQVPVPILYLLIHLSIYLLIIKYTGVLLSHPIRPSFCAFFFEERAVAKNDARELERKVCARAAVYTV